MASDRKAAQAVGKSVRACDNCVRRRARWYCAADDAFLCDSCDSSVHSANPLARRHERVRLKVSSSSKNSDDVSKAGAPTWQEGFTRKARTPRRPKKNGCFPVGLVPEEEEACSEEENEEQLLYRVPVFDGVNGLKSESDGGFARETDGFGGNIPSELDLDEFAADVESLLGKGLDDDVELGLGIFGQGDEECFLRIKDEDVVIGEAAPAAEEEEEEEEEGNLLQFDDFGSEGFELNFDLNFDCCEEEEEEEEEEEDENKRRIRENKALLKLDYDRVMSAWDYRKSPWTTGERPEFSSGDWWPDYFSGASEAMHAYGGHAVTAMARGARAGDGGREASVSRYREKRRTRLFSKKIRYEVRKLNAEKRPRMKGRFVKRASFASSAFPLLNK